MWNWPDEVLFITGASSGLGRAAALAGSERKSKLILLARNEDRLKEVKSEAEAKGASEIHTYPFDLKAVDDIETLYKKIVEETGLNPSVLMNIAGYNAPGFVLNTPTDVYLDNYKTNVLAPIQLMQCAAPKMFEMKKGVFVNIVSTAMFHSFPALSSYHSTKLAVSAIHESLKAELNGLPITSLCVNPGSFRSRYFDNADSEGRLGKYTYESKYDHLRKDPSIVAKAIFTAIEAGKEDIDLSAPLDRIGNHLSYWAPKLVDKIMVRNNKSLLENRPGA